MSGTTSYYEATQAAVVAHIESLGFNPEIYDIEWIVQRFPSPAAVDEMDMRTWLDEILMPPSPEDRAGAPCPSWCRYPALHPYESEDEEGRQVRFHAIQLEAPKGVDLSIVQEEKREKGNDSAITLGQINIWLTADVDDVWADEARDIATALQRAAAKFDEITSARC